MRRGSSTLAGRCSCPDSTTPISTSADGRAAFIAQQPNFTYTLKGRCAANLEGARLAHNNALRSPMDHGVFMALGSDILPSGPMVGIYAAVTRKGMSGEVYGAEETLTMEEAIRGYTAYGAHFTCEEDVNRDDRAWNARRHNRVVGGLAVDRPREDSRRRSRDDGGGRQVLFERS